MRDKSCSECSRRPCCPWLSCAGTGSCYLSFSLDYFLWVGNTSSLLPAELSASSGLGAESFIPESCGFSVSIFVAVVVVQQMVLIVFYKLNLILMVITEI